MNSSLLHRRLVPWCWAILTWCHENWHPSMGQKHIQIFKSWHEIKWLAGVADRAGIEEEDISLSTYTPPYCSSWAPSELLPVLQMGVWKQENTLQSREFIPLLTRAPSSALLPGSLFSWLQVFCVQPKGLLSHPAFLLGCHFVPACFTCPVFPLIWTGITIKHQFL